jgi:uncharacterized membrane protein SpoIIM required for sporulation/ABC-type transport system involved in multi-copper enzyme maturation permease subunit
MATALGGRLGKPGLSIDGHTLGETLGNALIITRREVRDSFRDWRIMAPIFALTLVFPVLAQGMTGMFTNFFVQNGAAPLIDNFLPLLPMIVGFFPVSISLVIALETFVGEKERRSLEPLLSTPLTNTELYIGKTFAAMIPPLLASYAGMAIYLGGLIFGSHQWRPEPELIIQILFLTTAQALVMVTGAVVVSSQTTSTRASNLLASFIIIPISMLVMLESFIMVTNNRYVLWYIVIGLFVADVMLFGMGARIFNREELLGRSIDEINIKWAWRLFWRQFRGDASQIKTIGEWYRYSVLPVLPKLRAPVVVVAISIVGVFVGGFLIAQVRPDLQIPAAATVGRDALMGNFQLLFQVAGNNPGSVIAAIVQNGRVLLAASLLAIFTFGVMGIFFATVPFGILGFLLGQPALASLGIGTFLAAVVPHSLVEIPAAVIAAAAAVRLGTVVTRPPDDQGVWEAWVRVLADTIKVGIGVVFPLLVIAAIIEVYITPRIVQLTLGG